MVISLLAVNGINFARGYYGKHGEQPSGFHVMQMAQRPLVALFDSETAHSFEAKKLKEGRESLIESGLACTSVSQVNHGISGTLSFDWQRSAPRGDVDRTGDSAFLGAEISTISD